MSHDCTYPGEIDTSGTYCTWCGYEVGKLVWVYDPDEPEGTEQVQRLSREMGAFCAAGEDTFADFARLVLITLRGEADRD